MSAGDRLPNIRGAGGRSVEAQPIVVLDKSGNFMGIGAAYDPIPAETTDQGLGDAGAAGDALGCVLIVPASTSPGAVSIKDGDGDPIVIFEGGENSVSNLVSFNVFLGYISVNGGWSISTGVDVSAVASGAFTN